MQSALTLFSGLALSSAALVQEKPYVLFILPDSFGYHQTGCCGSTYLLKLEIEQTQREIDRSKLHCFSNILHFNIYPSSVILYK